MSKNLGILKLLSLCLLLPGLAGLILAATISTHYLETLPRLPVAPELRMIPRNIHGTVVYQTEQEDRQLTWLEDGSMAVLAVGLGIGLVYVRKWGIDNALNAEDDDMAGELS